MKFRQLSFHRSMLSSVDYKLSRAGVAFSTVAGDDKLFLKHSNAPILEGCTLTETVRLLVATQNAINSLAECRLLYGDDWLVAQGTDVGLSMDDVFIANYEHLLLRLRAELIEALARKALEELLRGGHDKKQRKLLSWFTEFAEKPQPLSASFPWTIKPSLAVLWGVCWMFYDNNAEEQASRYSSDRVRQARVLQQLDFPWNAPASSDCKFRMLCVPFSTGFQRLSLVDVALGRELIGSPPQPAAQQQTVDNTHVSVENNLYPARNTGHWPSDLGPLHCRRPSLNVSQAGVHVSCSTRAVPPPRPRRY